MEGVLPMIVLPLQLALQSTTTSYPSRKRWTDMQHSLCKYESQQSCNEIISYLWCIIWCYLCLMLAYEIICFLVRRFPIFCQPSFCTKYDHYLCIQKTFNKGLPYEFTISTYMQYYFAVLSKFVCAISNFQNKLHFCVFVSLTER